MRKRERARVEGVATIDQLFDGRLCVPLSELAEWLDVSRDTLRRMAIRGDIKPKRIGGAVKFLARDVAAYLEG